MTPLILEVNTFRFLINATVLWASIKHVPAPEGTIVLIGRCINSTAYSTLFDSKNIHVHRGCKDGIKDYGKTKSNLSVHLSKSAYSLN